MLLFIGVSIFCISLLCACRYFSCKYYKACLKLFLTIIVVYIFNIIIALTMNPFLQKNMFIIRVAIMLIFIYVSTSFILPCICIFSCYQMCTKHLMSKHLTWFFINFVYFRPLLARICWSRIWMWMRIWRRKKKVQINISWQI